MGRNLDVLIQIGYFWLDSVLCAELLVLIESYLNSFNLQRQEARVDP